MKTSIYIEDSRLQVVLTPETKEEQSVVDLIEKKDIVERYRGAFFDCKGGWIRFRPYTEISDSPYDYPGSRRSDDSLIFVLTDKKLAPENHPEALQ